MASTQVVLSNEKDAAVPMEVEKTHEKSPHDPDFVDSLADPLQSIARKAIADTRSAPTVRLDELEIDLRSQLYRMERAEWGTYWTDLLKFCVHLVDYSTKHQDDEASPYKGMACRRLPLLLLEDILETLPLEAAKEFWATTVEPKGFEWLFSKLLWEDAKSNHLPFLKLCNQFIRRLQGGEWAGRILFTLSKVFPLSDKSATKVWGSFHTQNVTEMESPEEHQQQQQQDDSEQAKTDETSSYSLYETIWSLQKDFSNPSAIKVAVFLDRVKTLLAALESHTPLKHSCGSELLTQKYMTKSSLLKIQLVDPDFRIHVLTQFLIVEKHLSSESKMLGHALGDLQKRSKELLLQTKPHGAFHLKILEFCLERETHWRQWKKQKCKPMEKTAAKEKNKTTDSTDGAFPKKATPLPNEEFKPLSKDELKVVSKDLKKAVPSLNTHLADYIEALDPEAGIEAEYHPKNNALYSWRARRLLSRLHLKHLDKMDPTGDFERMVRTVYKEEEGMDIPGTMPEPVSLLEESSDEASVGEEKIEEENDDDNDDHEEGADGSDEEEEGGEGSPMEDEKEEKTDQNKSIETKDEEMEDRMEGKEEEEEEESEDEASKGSADDKPGDHDSEDSNKKEPEESEKKQPEVNEKKNPEENEKKEQEVNEKKEPIDHDEAAVDTIGRSTKAGASDDEDVKRKNDSPPRETTVKEEDDEDDGEIDEDEQADEGSQTGQVSQKEAHRSPQQYRPRSPQTRPRSPVARPRSPRGNRQSSLGKRKTEDRPLHGPRDEPPPRRRYDGNEHGHDRRPPLQAGGPRGVRGPDDGGLSPRIRDSGPWGREEGSRGRDDGPRGSHDGMRMRENGGPRVGRDDGPRSREYGPRGGRDEGLRGSRDDRQMRARDEGPRGGRNEGPRNREDRPMRGRPSEENLRGRRPPHDLPPPRRGDRGPNYRRNR